MMKSLSELPAPDLARRQALLAMAALAATGLAGCSDRGLTGAVPQFDYTLLDGSRHSSAALRGQVMLVNFWATSCTSCVKEMPQIVATHRRFAGRGLATLAVAMSYDAPALVSQFAESRQLPFGVVIDNTGAIARGFGDVRVTPTTYLVDRRGHVAQRFVGEPDFDALHALVDKLLAQA